MKYKKEFENTKFRVMNPLTLVITIKKYKDIDEDELILFQHSYDLIDEDEFIYFNDLFVSDSFDDLTL